MAIELEPTSRDDAGERRHSLPEQASSWGGVKRVLEPVSSLKLTVALFALSIFLIFAGTLAQVDKDIWEVIGQYFRCWFAWIPLQIFIPPSFVIPQEVRDANDVLLDTEKWYYWFMGIVPLGHWKGDNLGGGFWFPGGKLIGLLLAANLLAAHAVRFKAHANGSRLLAGIGAITIGCGLTWLIIEAGGNSKGIQTKPYIPYSTLWIGFEGLLGVLWLASGFGTAQLWTKTEGGSGRTRARFVLGLLATITVGLTVLLGWLLYSGAAARPSDASLRILWQLTQGGFAGAALLAGCWVVFGKRSGVVLLHAGVGLMMFYELQVALTAIETQMNLEEGETTNFVHDIRTYELAVIDKTSPDEDRVTAIPRSMIVRGEKIDLPELPFRIEIKDVVANSHLRAASSRDKNPATAGQGIEWFAEEKRPGSGTDMDSKVDMAAAYVTLTDRTTDKPIGTYLVGMLLSMSGEMDTFRVGDKTFELALRPKRYYKTYHFHLNDVRAENYIGTKTARHYASTVHIVDPTRGVDEEKTIWMNNPLRFADETFYQSNYYREPDTGIEHTTLSVVANSGWMMPYVSCMLVAIGMLAHFLILLVRFLMHGGATEITPEEFLRTNRLRERLGIEPAKSPKLQTILDEAPPGTWPSAVAAAVVVAVVGFYVAGKAMPPKEPELGYDFYQFGQLPVVQDGRVKPLDSAAYSALLAISGRSSVTAWPMFRLTANSLDSLKEAGNSDAVLSKLQKMENEPFGNKELFLKRAGELLDKSDLAKLHDLLVKSAKVEHERGREKISAVEWMLNVIAETETADHYEVFRVENLEVQETIGVKKREGMRYSFAEIRKQEEELNKQIRLARETAKKDRRQLSVYQRKILELDEKLTTFLNLQFAFGLHHRIRGETPEQVIRSFQTAVQFEKMVATQGQPVFAIGPQNKDQEWRTLSGAWLENVFKAVRNKEDADPTVTAWDTMLSTYTDSLKPTTDKTHKRPLDFNRTVETYWKQLDEHPPRDVDLAATRFEAWFNHFRPFFYADWLYLGAFIIVACGWLGWTNGFNRMAFWLLMFVFCVHTFALIGRMYISGRPPVTNLYSSAIFIGWASVKLGLILERIYKIGIGNLIASVAGFATLLIADGLALKGDTFTVLQAVLDTQFWLATHVTCITLGYATTYLAGLLGLVYVLRGVFTPSLTHQVAHDLNRMIYGTLCFSIFFSFVGTVLGGLWADDSWGRFWGWDPKENGALIIVLWNALVLHARWGGMVKLRGLAVLSIVGNIFVSWSWWGVNELGAGLHSYGFTEGTVMKLGLFVISQLVLIGVGTIPLKNWRSAGRSDSNDGAVHLDRLARGQVHPSA